MRYMALLVAIKLQAHNEASITVIK